MLSLSEPSVNQALDSRSKQLFWIAWQFLIVIYSFNWMCSFDSLNLRKISDSQSFSDFKTLTGCWPFSDSDNLNRNQNIMISLPDLENLLWFSLECRPFSTKHVELTEEISPLVLLFSRQNIPHNVGLAPRHGRKFFCKNAISLFRKELKSSLDFANRAVHEHSFRLMFVHVYLATTSHGCLYKYSDLAGFAALLIFQRSPLISNIVCSSPRSTPAIYWYASSGLGR